jgi:hypothetical protein
MNRLFWLWLSCGLLVSPGLVDAQAVQKPNRKSAVVTIGELKSQTPTDWVEEKPANKFRVAQFRLEPVNDDKDAAEVVIFFFGEGGGGTVADNIKRWKDMFIPPEGKKIDDVAKVEKKKINGLAATYFEIQGTYLSRERQFDPNAKVSRRPNYRMIKLILETKKGPYYFSLIGPENTVAHYKKGFDGWIEGFKVRK